MQKSKSRNHYAWPLEEKEWITPIEDKEDFYTFLIMLKQKPFRTVGLDLLQFGKFYFV